ncbi:hypothetical protein F5148DRAFT_220281 [Russula earlei]|uniref:Uncharacterized protein n=1 Tax=Russula earlei TaxID=71964 RepID=A0ACC0U4K8_9AGAM|nr:hypothetical protein F5148DRAFT_220281 [Russula earlei]
MSERIAAVGSRDDGAAPNVPQGKDLGVAFLGPNSLALFISAIEMGVIVACFARFLARSEKERMAIRLLVYFVTCVAVFQTGATFAMWWKFSVQDFGNWSAAAVPGWPQKIHSSLTTLLAAPVQLFLIWRCWNILPPKRRWLTATPLVFLVIGTIVTTLYVTVIMFLLQFKSKATKSLSLNAFFTCFALSLVFSAIVDIVVTSILLVFLMRSRSRVSTRQFRKVLSQLIIMTWESAIPPCACAIAALIACFVGAPFVSYWSVMLQVILGKLYLISLFVTLEGRAKLASTTDLTHFPTLTNVTRRDGTWSVHPAELESNSSKPADVPLAFVPYKMEPSNDANDATIEGCSLDPESSRSQLH